MPTVFPFSLICISLLCWRFFIHVPGFKTQVRDGRIGALCLGCDYERAPFGGG